MIRRYRGLAADLGVLDRVEMLGALPRQAVPTVLRNAHVVACCPWYEPFGMVALEAMACGVPVVATAVGGLAETVVSAQTGLLVPPREPGAIAAALRQLRDQPRLVIEMGRRAAVRARSYGWWSVAAATRHGLHQIAHPVASSEVDVSA
jgi:glycosyltransferase involved in cell wall biosynthesis